MPRASKNARSLPATDHPSATCRKLQTPLTEEQAYSVVDTYFEAAQEIFGAYERASALGNLVVGVKLSIESWAHDSPRHFAATADTGRMVICAPEIVELPPETVAAIVAHEFGHVLDHLYPGQFWLTGDGGVRFESDIMMDGSVRDPDDKRKAQARVARMAQWVARDDDTVERTADAVAELVTGRRIGYAGPCVIQAFDRGVQRPAGLR